MTRLRVRVLAAALLTVCLVPASASAQTPPRQGGPRAAPPATAPTPVPAPLDPAAGLPATQAPPRPTGATLQALEKITGRVRAIVAPFGVPVAFGALEITVRDCRIRPARDIPDSGAFLEVNERRAGETALARVFTGWMFAASPAVSALEHPVYDVWLLSCSTAPVSTAR
jgi:hypothetical protein